jgi:hypothetical protein
LSANVVQCHNRVPLGLKQLDSRWNHVSISYHSIVIFTSGFEGAIFNSSCRKISGNVGKVMMGPGLIENHGDSRWNFIAILYTTRGRGISIFEAAILDFWLPVACDSIIDLENRGL